MNEKNGTSNNHTLLDLDGKCDSQSNESTSLDRRPASIGSSSSSGSLNSQLSNIETTKTKQEKAVPNLNRKLPAKAVVVQQRIPNAYDKKALKLEVLIFIMVFCYKHSNVIYQNFIQKGDIITVTNTNINGQWEGELNGKKGHFPFNYIKFVDDDVETA